MSRPIFFFAFAIISCHGSKLAPEIPTFIRVCRRSNPRLNDCIKRSVEALKPYLRTGVPELRIPPCEPLSIPEIELNQASGPVSIRSIYKAIEIWGVTHFNLKSIKLDMHRNRIKIKLFIPHLQMQSYYNMQGKILMLPIFGQGRAFGNYTDIDVVTMIQGERYFDRLDEKLHFRVTGFYCNFEVGHASIHLDNLFKGDEKLSDAMNRFLNDNWKTVAVEMKPSLENSMARLFKNFSNKIFNKYSIDALLPP